MPLYEFFCQDCEKQSEILVRSSDWKGTRCPNCGSAHLTKQISVFASNSTGGAVEEPPVCSGTPRSCGLCGTGRPHSH